MDERLPVVGLRSTLNDALDTMLAASQGGVVVTGRRDGLAGVMAVETVMAWYDEVASIGLAWLTYYGSALAALRGAHIGFPGIVNAMPPRLRLAVALFGEACVFLFFIVLFIISVFLLLVLGGLFLGVHLILEWLLVGAFIILSIVALFLVAIQVQIIRQVQRLGFGDLNLLLVVRLMLC